MSGWYATHDTSSTWFEASDALAWVPSGQNLTTSEKYSPYIIDINSSKNLKPGKSEVAQRISKEVKLEDRTPIVSPPETENFFQLPSNSLSDQNAWNAYVISNSSNYWDSPNPTEPQNSLLPEKVMFSKLKRNVDIEQELTKQNLYKTELCQSWISTGACRYGNKCQYAHGKDELRPVLRHPKYKTEICKTFSTTGQCPYGKRCRFVHQLAELRSDQEEEEMNELQLKLQEINLSLAPDPVFPATGPSLPTAETQAPVVKKGSRLPFLQKLRKQL